MKTSLFANGSWILGLMLILLAAGLLVLPVLAAPVLDGGVSPTQTPTHTPTNTPEPTATPQPTAETAREPTQAAGEQPPTEAVTVPETEAPPETSPTEQTGLVGTSNTTSILGFLLCVGVIIVLGLLALNFWPNRRV